VKKKFPLLVSFAEKDSDDGDIKAVALDVDGVLTDGTFIWGPNGEEYKQFHFRM